MRNFITIAITVCLLVFWGNSLYAAPQPAEILEDTAAAYSFAQNWLEDLWLPILGFLAFTGVISFWLKGNR